MKKLFTLLLLALTINAQAAIKGAPFIPEVDSRFNALEQGQSLNSACNPLGSCDGHWIKQVAQATYDFAKYGGALTAGTSLGVSLPKNAIITRSYIYSTTQPTGNLNATLAFFCQNAGDIIGATGFASYGAAGASIDGASTGAATAFKYTTAACNIQFAIATATLTAGKVTAYVEYAVHQ